MSSHAHSVALNHQFDDLQQQNAASNMGMWAFIAQEIMFFGGLFAGYTVYRYKYLAAFTEGSNHLPIELGALNTAILIGSSFTMAMAVRSAQVGEKGPLLRWILATMALGIAFLGVKSIEYADKYHHNLVPGLSFEGSGQLKIFFSFYFAMTGMHALHMIIGLGIMLWMIPKIRRGTYTREYFSLVENFGLYWHFVDLVWIVIFTIVYLVETNTG